MIVATALAFPSPPTSPLPVPPEWTERFAAGELLYTVADPLDGLTPSIGNGFISGDAGCSVPSKLQPGSCGRIHLGGVFQGGAGHQKRADLVNPFAVVTAKATRRAGFLEARDRAPRFLLPLPAARTSLSSPDASLPRTRGSSGTAG